MKQPVDWNTLARDVADATPRRRLLRVLGLLPIVGALSTWQQPEPAAADGAGAIVGGGHRRHKRRRHDHHRRNPKRRCARKCSGCCDGKGKCHRNDAKACGIKGKRCKACGSGEICSSGICHNPYGCTAAMDYCFSDPQNPSFVPCPDNPNGVCILLAEGPFCILIGDVNVDPNVSQCAPEGNCANCPAGSDCVTPLGGICVCPGNKGCAVPPPA